MISFFFVFLFFCIFCKVLAFVEGNIRFEQTTTSVTRELKWLYIANSSWHWGSYGSIWTGPSPKKYYMDRSFRGPYNICLVRRFWGPYTIFLVTDRLDRSFWGPYNMLLVTDRSIYCHMTRSDMNYLLYYTFYLK